MKGKIKFKDGKCMELKSIVEISRLNEDVIIRWDNGELISVLDESCELELVIEI
jgi:hypothetical protein